MSEVQKTITLVGKTTKALTKVSADIEKQMVELRKLTEISEDLGGEIEFSAAELSRIEDDRKEELRKSKAELSIAILENEDKVLANMQANRGLAYISDSELKELRDSYLACQDDQSGAINAAVVTAVSSVKSAARTQEVELIAKQSVETATLKADISSLMSRVKFLTDSNDSLKDMLDEERRARVAIAGSAVAPTFQVASGK